MQKTENYGAHDKQDMNHERTKHEQLHFDRETQEAFRSFLDTHREELVTGLGAFHTDDHSNW